MSKIMRKNWKRILIPFVPKASNLVSRAILFLTGVVYLVEGIVAIVTLGFIRWPDLTLDMYSWYLDNEMDIVEKGWNDDKENNQGV